MVDYPINCILIPWISDSEPKYFIDDTMRSDCVPEVVWLTRSKDSI